MSSVQRRADRPGVDLDRGRDCVVVEIRVVTQKQNESLPLGQSGDGGARVETFLSRYDGSSRKLGDLFDPQLTPWLLITPLLQRSVNDRAPHPAGKRTRPAEIVARTNDAHEPVMNRVPTAFK